MSDDRSPSTDVQQVDIDAPAEPALVEEELVDEISIDGMCGVY